MQCKMPELYIVLIILVGAFLFLSTLLFIKKYSELIEKRTQKLEEIIKDIELIISVNNFIHDNEYECLRGPDAIQETIDMLTHYKEVVVRELKGE
jgi:hypothetical protein